MTVIYPEATPAQGNIGVKAILTIVDEAAASLATEVNAASSLDLSCFLRDWNPDMQPNTGTSQPRLCAGIDFPIEGRTQYQPIEVRYVYDPQGDAGSDENKALDLLVQGTILYVLVRKGPDADEDAYEAGQKYELWRVRAGKQRKVRSDGDEFAEFEIAQNLYPIAEPVDGVIAA